ncbi:MAG: hypothetical protein Kow0047_27350 [Anaerolineae bacterium]
MSGNPFLRRMGFSPTDKVVIFHADDLGMCHATNQAFADIVQAGTVRCGSAMVPCPWFNEIAAYARTHPEADIGVHTTLTAEWRLYRWSPISTRDRESGLLDDEGYMWADVSSLHAHMDPRAALAELRAQVDRALDAGIDVTHIDTHMGAVIHPALVEGYLQMASEYSVPVLLPRPNQEVIERFGIPPSVATMLTELEKDATWPLFDHVVALFGAPAPRRLEQYQRLLQELSPGLICVIYHPIAPGDEGKAIMPEQDWEGRIADWEVFSGPAFREWLQASGIHAIGYRDLRDAMRSV